jgi:hypothetical protein
MGAETPGGAGGREEPPSTPRGEMDAAPPFLFLTWRPIYAIVLGALAAEIAAGIALSSLLS